MDIWKGLPVWDLDVSSLESNEAFADSFFKDMRKLTLRTHTGAGYSHQFVHNTTGEITFVPCTQDEYEALALPGTPTPTLSDHTWMLSTGGTYKVDTADETLGEDEYCIVDTDAVVRLSGKTIDVQFKVLPVEEVVTGNVNADIWQNGYSI